MRKVVLIRILAMVVGVIMILGTLMSITLMPNQEDNGFIRNLSDNAPVKPEKVWHFKEDLTKIIGYTNNSIFIAGQVPTSFLIVGRDFVRKDTLVVNYDIPPNKMVPFSSYVDSPKMYIHVNNLRKIIYGKFPNDTLKLANLSAGTFSKSIQISDSETVVRAFSENMMNQTFKKVNMLTGQVVKDTNYSELVDNSAGLMTDGVLVFEPRRKLIIYVEYFRNNIYCMDTDLNLIYKSKTIDTTNTNSIGMGHENVNDSVKKFVPDVARVKVNENCFVDNTNLYVVSGKRGDNQKIQEYNANISIDQYSLIDGEYIRSFMIKKVNNKVFKSAAIIDNKLYALFDKEVKVYPLIVLDKN